MVREARYIREVSPFLQGFYVELLRGIYSRRDAGDIEGYKRSLQFLFISCPMQVKLKALNKITDFFRKLGILGKNDKIEDIDDALSLVDRVCSETMKQYGVPLREKRKICMEEGTALLDIIYEILVSELHENEIFIIHKQLLVGVHAGEGEA